MKDRCTQKSGDHQKKDFVAGMVKIILLASIVLLISVGLYARLWELRQPEVVLEGVQVTKILPYRKGGGDLHWSLNGRRVYIREDKRLIDFPMKRWNSDIHVGDSVRMTVRRSFFGDELDGLEIHRIR